MESDALKRLGLDAKKEAETAKNAALTRTIGELIAMLDKASGDSKKETLPKHKSVLIYTMATKFPVEAASRREAIVALIASEKIKRGEQLEAAMKLLKSKPDVAIEEAEKEAGVGVEVSAEELGAAIDALFAKHKEELTKSRYRTPLGPLLGALRNDARIKWADGKALKDTFDAKLAALLGPRTPEDDAPAPKEAKAKPDAKPAAVTAAAVKEEAKKKEEEVSSLADNVKFPAPSENRQRKPELLTAHLAATGGRVVTRFPPEPNGFLHLGHAKAMNLSFGYAKKHNGWCYMRFDDTNPQTEKQVYIDSILDNLKWLSHTPYKVTYASDHFQALYDFAVELIKRDKAYVDHSSKEEMADQREKKEESKWRNRPIAESLRLFEDMRKGKLAEGAATLRLKMDMQSPNPCMRDLVAYRIKFVPHPHAGDKWCIYPSYDYTHPICDSLENITHSLCTLEFEVRRENYNWLIHQLEIYLAPQIEYSRLNVTYTVLSKRKLIQLVEGKYVRGWDDPRMPTINGLRRRGVTPGALEDFCERIGITRHANVIRLELFEQCIRQALDDVSVRVMCVQDPIKVSITNFAATHEARTVRHHPTHDLGSHMANFSATVFIDRSDFREKDEKDYYGLAPGKEVNLKYAYNIRCEEVIKDGSGRVVELRCTYDAKNERKPKGHLHWVGGDSLECEVRLYDRLFKSEDPAGLKDAWLADLNPASLVILPHARIDPFVRASAAAHVLSTLPARFQFERVGFFCVDPDSTPERLVFNRTVSLKDSYHKSADH